MQGDTGAVDNVSARSRVETGRLINNACVRSYEEYSSRSKHTLGMCLRQTGSPWDNNLFDYIIITYMKYLSCIQLVTLWTGLLVQSYTVV